MTADNGFPDLYGVIRDEKVLFPAHEDKVRLVQLVVVKGVGVERLGILVERDELGLKIDK